MAVRALTMFVSYSMHVSIVGLFTLHQKRIHGGREGGRVGGREGGWEDGREGEGGREGE